MRTPHTQCPTCKRREYTERDGLFVCRPGCGTQDHPYKWIALPYWLGCPKCNCSAIHGTGSFGGSPSLACANEGCSFSGLLLEFLRGGPTCPNCKCVELIVDGAFVSCKQCHTCTHLLDAIPAESYVACNQCQGDLVGISDQFPRSDIHLRCLMGSCGHVGGLADFIHQWALGQPPLYTPPTQNITSPLPTCTPEEAIQALQHLLGNPPPWPEEN